MRKLLPLCALLLLVGATSAFAMGKGASMLSLQFGQGQGDFAQVFDPNIVHSDNYIDRNPEVPRDQLQFGAEYWYGLSEEYAFTGAFAIGMWPRRAISRQVRPPPTSRTRSARAAA